MGIFNRNNNTMPTRVSGFSLLEILIVMAILAIIGAIGSGIYANYGRGIELNSVAESVSFDLKLAQSKSMVGEGGFLWGLHFVNGSPQQYYEIFSTPTNYADVGKVVVATTTLASSVKFTTPATASSLDIIFNKISGSTTGSSVVITNQSGSKTISVSSVGAITIQ